MYLLPHDRGDDPSRAAVTAKFAEVDALPCTQTEAAPCDGDREEGSRERRFGVGRHVVVPFERVDVIGFAFGDESVEYGFQIGADVRIGVLVEAQCGRGVSDEQVQQSRAGQRRQVAQHLFGDEVESLGTGREREFFLCDHDAGVWTDGGDAVSGRSADGRSGPLSLVRGRVGNGPYRGTILLQI